MDLERAFERRRRILKGKEKRVLSSMGKQSSSKFRTEPKLTFSKTKLKTSFLVNSKSENPGPNSYDVRTRHDNQKGHTFGEGRSYMYDNRSKINSFKLGPGEYYVEKYANCLGHQWDSTRRSEPAVTINSRDRERDVISGNDPRYFPNITFSRRDMQDIPGPARYDNTSSNRTSQRKQGAIFRRDFIKSVTRPSWCSRLEDKYNRHDDRSDRPLTSSMGSQTTSNNTSLPAHRFGKSYRLSPDLWISSPDVYPSPSLTPGVGRYRFDAAFALGPQKLSHNTSAPSFGFSRSKRFETRSYYSHADKTRIHGGIRRRRAARRIRD